MMKNSEIDDIKRRIAIPNLLASRGIQPVSQKGVELTYHSPLRDVGNGSFVVDVRENVFRDADVAEHRGDVIRLVQLLDGTDFATATRILQGFEGQPDRPRFFLSGPSSVPPVPTDRIRKATLLSNRTLLNYLESRGIRIGLGRKYLSEVHYDQGDRHFYALGLKNDSGGFALRNGIGCQRFIGPSDITRIAGRYGWATRTANVFDGMFAFLSYLEFSFHRVPLHPTFILNGVGNLSRLLDHVGQYARLNVYFDRDKAGRDAFGTLQGHNLPVYDRSELYVGHNDFNDFLLSSKQP